MKISQHIDKVYIQLYIVLIYWTKTGCIAIINEDILVSGGLKGIIEKEY